MQNNALFSPENSQTREKINTDIREFKILSSKGSFGLTYSRHFKMLSMSLQISGNNLWNGLLTMTAAFPEDSAPRAGKDNPKDTRAGTLLETPDRNGCENPLRANSRSEFPNSLQSRCSISSCCPSHSCPTSPEVLSQPHTCGGMKGQGLHSKPISHSVDLFLDMYNVLDKFVETFPQVGWASEPSGLVESVSV